MLYYNCTIRVHIAILHTDTEGEFEMQKRNITPLDFYRLCYTLNPDILVSVYSAEKTDCLCGQVNFGQCPVYIVMQPSKI